LDSKKLAAMEDYAFARQGTEEDRDGTRTDSVVIIKDGFLVYEKYARGYGPKDKHLIWSITKSYINAWVGIAVREGKIGLDDLANQYLGFEELSPDHNKITIRNLLQMSSGLSANEGYESSPLNSTVIAMLYTNGRENMGEYCFRLPMRAEPGSFVYYSSCDTNILSLILQKIYGEDYSEFPKKKIFEPLGITDITWEKDGSGVYVGSSYIYTTPRDLAKFGYLYLNNGNWEGKKILPNGWVTFTRTPASGYSTTPYYEGLEKDNYTAHWYANTGVPEAGIPRPIPDAPAGTFFGSGHWGQRIYIIPELDMVVVRMGDDRNTKFFDENRFLKSIVEAVK
jgi:CubicO group peptidase (beta-lactamase class C family)